MALLAWRDKTAKRRGVPDYLVLPNATINAIAQALPTTPEELLAVKGIKQAKLREFGNAILDIVNGTDETSDKKDDSIQEPTDAVSVSRYLNALNSALAMTGEARVIGEVGGVKEQGSAIYFTLKDQGDGSAISVFMWRNAYALSGLSLEEGMVIIATGTAEIYKPTGRLSLRAETVELVGEGALKAAYEKLKKQLEKEGLFAPERKRPLPQLPTRIGLVTSKTGAVIHDFLNNLGKYGIRISFVDSRVEGVLAVKDILDAIATLQSEKIDILVIVRGGGSLESLQAFNNEHVVRAIAKFPVPVICAIGHHEDVPLAQLAADVAPSTPTACAIAVNEGWEEAIAEIGRIGQSALIGAQTRIMQAQHELRNLENSITTALRTLLDAVSGAEYLVVASLERYAFSLSRSRERLYTSGPAIARYFETAMRSSKRNLLALINTVSTNDPRRLLASGYALAFRNGKLLRSVVALQEGDAFQVRVSDGKIDSLITRIERNAI
jgi:exodeoxyribonuclease VII large subunit